jgi:bile acid:Na+ symporter, BASS family
MLLRIKHLIESNLFGVILVAFALGLTLPGLAVLPAWFVFGPLMGLVYCACVQARGTDLRAVRVRPVAVFYVSRFVVLPLALYAVAATLLPTYKEAILLIALAPTAGSAGAWVGLWGGNASLAFAYSAVSSVLAPVVVPLLLFAVGYAGQDVDTGGMATTLALVIGVPAAFHWVTARRLAPVARVMRAHMGLACTALLFVFLVLAIGQRRADILANPMFILTAAPVMTGLYALFFAVGWVFPAPGSRPERVARTVASGLNNLGIMSGLALLYFPPMVFIAMLAASPVWNGSLVALKRLLGPR